MLVTITMYTISIASSGWAIYGSILAKKHSTCCCSTCCFLFSRKAIVSSVMMPKCTSTHQTLAHWVSRILRRLCVCMRYSQNWNSVIANCPNITDDVWNVVYCTNWEQIIHFSAYVHFSVTSVWFLRIPRKSNEHSNKAFRQWIQQSLSSAPCSFVAERMMKKSWGKISAITHDLKTKNTSFSRLVGII